MAVIYGWTGSSYADVSTQYKSYYQQQLQTLQQQTPPTPDNAGYAECLSAETAKLQRFLGLDSTAGLDNAITWAGSENPAEREFAAPILADIGTPEAMADLQTLGHDSDNSVAIIANGSLARTAKGLNVNTPASVTVSPVSMSTTNTTNGTQSTASQ
jgi:hypothetical protein